jgi:hypothetical protein
MPCSVAGRAVIARTRRCHPSHTGRTGEILSAGGVPVRHHWLVSRSVRSDPRRLRAARRAAFPAVRTRRPAPGRHHPATAADVRAALAAFGAEAYYGVRLLELVPATPGEDLQHERRLRGERAARTRDHEARAEAIAAGLRQRLASC